MLQKKKCCCEYNECFDRSERLFQDKMNSWYEPAPCSCHDAAESECPHFPFKPDSCETMELAMAYVKKQKLNPDTIKNCRDALTAGTLFTELELPFTGGDSCE